MKKGWVILVSILLVIFMTISIFLVVNIYKMPKAKSENNNSAKGTAVAFNTGAPFITNVKDNRSILKCDIYIEAKDKDAAEQLEQYVPQIRDQIITILRDLTIEDIEKRDIQEELKESIKIDLQENLGLDDIGDIYFNEFVVQY